VSELERIERDAYGSMFAAAPPSAGAAVRSVADARCIFLRGVPTTMLNRVCGLGIDGPPTTGDLEEIDDFFGSAAYAVAVAPEADGLADLLETRGFVPAYAWMKFRRHSAPPPPVTTDLRVVAIDGSSGGDLGRVIGGAFGLRDSYDAWWAAVAAADGWHCFVAYADEEPAAAGALYASGSIGWVGVAGTLPEFRRRGGQSAIMAARIERARDLGIELLVTETGERRDGRPSNSYRNILRFGFEEAYVRPNYERAAT
jgi:GNAT superfamily N-acetyltransferase